MGWLAGFGPVIRVGVEGTGSYGVGLARFLAATGIEVVEVDRPNRQVRRKKGKSDPTDAVVAAARAALSGEASVIPKARNGPVEQMRVLLVARRSARQQRIQSLNQLRHLILTAPESSTRRDGRSSSGFADRGGRLGGVGVDRTVGDARSPWRSRNRPMVAVSMAPIAA